MQKKLDNLLEDQLAVRVHISKTTALFSTRELAIGFAMSLPTLHRYISPEARELSREAARRQNLNNSMSRREHAGRCFKCKHELADHPRCVCDILLHGGAGNCGSKGCIDILFGRTITSSKYGRQ